MFLPHKIKDARKNRGLTQKQLADIIGVSPPLITNWENGNRSISVDWLVKLATALNFPPSYFFETDEGVPVSAELQELYDLLQKLNDEELKTISQTARLLAKANEKN